MPRPARALDLPARDVITARARGARPYVLAPLRSGAGLDRVIRFIADEGGVPLRP